MEDFGKFLLAGVAGGGLSAVLLAIAAVLGKSQLAHWLNKDIEGIKARHQKDLEADKAKYARELDAYRTALIAQAESIKANQDVRKAMAIKMAEKRFSAIDRLHFALSDIHLKTIAFSSMAHSLNQGRFEDTYNSLRKDGIELASAIALADAFLLREEKIVLDRLAAEQIRLLTDTCSSPDFRLSPLENLQSIKSLTEAHEAAYGIVKIHLDQMLAMANIE